MGFRPTIWENIFFYKFLGGVFSGNTRKKCAGVYNGIPMVYFGGYVLYQQYVFMYQQYVYGFASRCPLVVYEL